MFDSPMEHCAVCGKMVTLAQSHAECRRKHACAEDKGCPLRDYFSGGDEKNDRRREPPAEK